MSLEKKEMTVVHLAEAWGGGVYYLIKNLVEQTPTLNHIIIHGNRKEIVNNFSKEFPSNVKFINWKYAQREIHPSKDFLALISLANILRNEKFDIIHVHSSKAGFLGRFLGFLMRFNKKLIYSPHGISFERLDISKRKRKIYKFLEKFAASLGGSIITSCKSESNVFTNIGIKNTYINNGIKINNTNYNKPINNKLLITNVGRATIQKDPSFFNSIAECINDKEIEFQWIGDGELNDQLTSKNITTYKWVEYNKLVQLLKRTDIYMSTSLWEGMPLAPLEGMNQYCIMLMRKCTGNIDLVDNKVNGYEFNTIDEAVKYIKEFKIKKQNHQLTLFSHASKEKLKHEFNIDKMAEDFFKFYKKLNNNKNLYDKN